MTPSPPVLDIDALVLPIPGDNPGGVPLPELLRTELERLRKSTAVSADITSPGSAKRPAPDFRAIIADATDALVNTSKDLALVLRLVEALTKVHAAAGLRDGLRLAQRIVTDCWEWVHPIPKHAEDASRGNRFKWVNTADSGAEFPQTVQQMPIIECGSDSFCHFDTLDPARSAELDGALSSCRPDALKTTYADLKEAMDALLALGSELRKRLGDDDTPDFTGMDKPNLGLALRNCLQTVEMVAGRRNVSLDGAPPPGESDGDASTTTDSSSGGGGGSSSRRGGDSRDALYADLDRIAIALKRVEPHSPVPYLLERCVKLGAMPFPDLMRSVLRDSGALSELDKLLGLEPS